jgi:hypothetical protein
VAVGGGSDDIYEHKSEPFRESENHNKEVDMSEPFFHLLMIVIVLFLSFFLSFFLTLKEDSVILVVVRKRITCCINFE